MADPPLVLEGPFATEISAMPILLWFLGVPLTLIIVLWLIGVF